MVGVRMPFGKFRGQLLEDLPTNYLHWLADLDNLRSPLREQIQDELGWRREEAEAERSLRGTQGPVPDIHDVIRAWYREMTLRFHPDRGGSTDAQAALNHAHDRLQEMLRTRMDAT